MVGFHPDNITRLSCHNCALATICLPSTLNAEAKLLLEESVEQQAPLAKGEMLYRAGDTFAGLYVVKSGSLKAVMLSSGGDEQVVSFSMPGAIIGYDGFEGRYASTVSALEQSTVCFLSEAGFDQLSREVPAVAAYVHRAIGRDLKAMNEMKLLIAQRPAEERLACFLFSLADCFTMRGFSGRKFQLSMSRHDIANFLGLAPETVSRLFTHLREEGIISMEGKWVNIRDAEQLRQTTCVYVGELDGCTGRRSAAFLEKS